MDSCSIEITMDVYAHADTEQARVELKRIKPKLDELNQSADKIISMPNLALLHNTLALRSGGI